MTLYARRQLLVLLATVGVAGGGLAVGRWRRAHPELAERLERLDETAAPVAEDPPPPARPLPPVAEPLDLNRASAAELERLPGVGPRLAGRIVAARAREGPFGSVDDLRRVGGIRRGTLERLRPLVTVGP